MGQELKSNEGQIHSQLTLVELLKKDPTNVQAWAMLAKLVDSPERKKIYIDKALALDPDNEDLQAQARKLGVDAQQKIIAPVPIETIADPIVETPEVDIAEPVAETIPETPVPSIVEPDPAVNETVVLETSSEETAVIEADASINETVLQETSSEKTSIIDANESIEATIVSESEEVTNLVDKTIVTEDKADIQQDTLVQSDAPIEETIEKETNVVAEPTIEVDADSQLDSAQDLSQADDARARVQEILSALGVQPRDTNSIETASVDSTASSLINNLDETLEVSDVAVEKTVLESMKNVGANSENTFVQDLSTLSQQDTILEADAIFDDPLATMAQDLALDDTLVGEPEVVVDAAQQRIDQIRDSIKPMEEPSFQTKEPQLEYDQQAAAVLPSRVEDFGEQTAVIEPPSRVIQGLLAIASVVAFSFFAYEFIEFLNNTTGFNWPNYR